MYYWVFINTAPRNVYFILHYDLFLRKYFFPNVYISVNTVFGCSYFSIGWETGRSLKYIRNEGNGGGHPERFQIRNEGEGHQASCLRTLLQYLFSCFCLMVSCFVCRNLTLPLFRKGAFVRKGYFSPMISISVVMKWASFYFKLLFRTKVSQNGFNFNQTES